MIYQETIGWKGAPNSTDAVHVEEKTFIISGRFVKTASLKKEWQEDVEDPPEVLRELKASPAKIDLLRFWQRIPETEPKYDYYHEWLHVAAIPITDYKDWWEKRVNSNTRRLVRKSEKLGVRVGESRLDDELVLGIMDIFNESPVRRGKPFRHYGKDFEMVKTEMSLDLDESVFITAYFGTELIGFIKLVFTDRYGMVTMILDKKSHRDKSPVNGMVAKAVQICVQRKVSFLTYTLWRKGGHGYFQDRNGFEKISVPEYYAPLTIKGELALRLRLHKGMRGLLPENLKRWLLAARAKWYSLRCGQKAVA